MKDLKIWQYVESKIIADNYVILLIVANASKASPGRTGFKMAICDDSTSIGTIGGGIMEFDIVNEANELLSQKKNVCFFRKLHHSNLGNGDKSGLICGGVQTIIFKSLGKSDLNIIRTIIKNIESQIAGLVQISKSNFSFSPSNKIDEDILFISDIDNWVLKENIGTPSRVYIVGGGHVGLAVSRVMSTLDFYVTVFDHREEVATLSQNVYADKIIITPYNYINNFIIEGEKSYVVIVTPSHDGDKDALKTVLQLKLKYIGSMGSTKKIKSIFAQLKEDGFSDEELKQIHTPIGLEIEAETPEEIAISIASEIIKVKNEI